jgi:nucleosome binding factor SPN SPT16 subunit
MPIYQFLLLITPEKITVLCSQKKADIIETLKQGDKQIALEVIRRGKNSEENVPLYQSVIERLNNVSYIARAGYACSKQTFFILFFLEKSRCFC